MADEDEQPTPELAIAVTPLPEGEDEAAARSRVARLRERLARLDRQEHLLGLTGSVRRRLPGDPAFGDPLSTAGDSPAHVVGRQVSVLGADRPSVSREVGLGALQLWQALAERSGRGRGDEEVTLLFTDLVGFSNWALQAGDEAALRLLRAVGTAVEPAIATHRGRITKRLGDGLMATFLSPEDGVLAALEAQEALAGVEVDGHRPMLRAGLHVGRPRRLGGDYLGVDVNVAARVMDATGGEEVAISSVLADRLDAERFTTGRRKRLRASGIPDGLRVCSVRRA